MEDNKLKIRVYGSNTGNFEISFFVLDPKFISCPSLKDPDLVTGNYKASWIPGWDLTTDSQKIHDIYINVKEGKDFSHEGALAQIIRIAQRATCTSKENPL